VVRLDTGSGTTAAGRTDGASDAAAERRVIALVGDGVAIPGHDPSVMRRRDRRAAARGAERG
jgi:hypothetical protein